MALDINKINDEFFEYLDKKSKKQYSENQLKAIKYYYIKKHREKKKADLVKRFSRSNFEDISDIFRIL